MPRDSRVCPGSERPRPNVPWPSCVAKDAEVCFDRLSHPECDNADVRPDVINEALNALRALGHSESDAHKLIDAAWQRNAASKNVDHADPGHLRPEPGDKRLTTMTQCSGAPIHDRQETGHAPLELLDRPSSNVSRSLAASSYSSAATASSSCSCNVRPTENRSRKVSRNSISRSTISCCSKSDSAPCSVNI